MYFAQEAGGEAIKIGYTSGTPTHRVTSLAVERGKMLEIVGLIIGNKKTEAELHERFNKARIEGEWF